MNESVIRSRIGLVGASSGSVVSVGTWCSLHAANFDPIMDAVCQRLTAPDTADDVRAALVYVLHEVLLNCATTGAARGAQQVVLRSVQSRLPAAVHRVCALPPDTERGAFLAALRKALGWWATLRLFPAPWLSALRTAADSAPGAAETALRLTLQAALDAATHYAEAARLSASLRAGGHEGAATDADAAARRALEELQRLGGRLDSSALLEWCHAEAHAAYGAALPAVAGVKLEVAGPGPAKRVKLESGDAGRTAGSGAAQSAKDEEHVVKTEGGTDPSATACAPNAASDEDDDVGDVLDSFY